MRWRWIIGALAGGEPRGQLSGKREVPRIGYRYPVCSEGAFIYSKRGVPYLP
jgi:hypothetical protein